MEMIIDFIGVNTADKMHKKLKHAFGFPNFYGANIHALIDCLGDIRYPEYGMSEVTVGKNEVLNLTIKNFPYENDIIMNVFFLAIKSVNEKSINRHETPSIHLILI